MEKRPLTSVIVPVVVPLTAMVAPISGSPSSAEGHDSGNWFYFFCKPAFADDKNGQTEQQYQQTTCPQGIVGMIG